MSPRTGIPLTSSTISSSVRTRCSSCLKREFSSTPPMSTRQRINMFAWLEGHGRNFRNPIAGETNYLTAYDRKGNLRRASDGFLLEGSDQQPFPLNKQFTAESILSEPLRVEVWRRVQIEKKSVRTVSAELGIEMRRVGAVVRLVELENRMREERKALAVPYARAVHSMVQTTKYDPNKIVPHESINDLPVHPLTDTQVFYPTSESRAFNRTDAGRVFSAAPRLPDELDAAEGGEAPEPWMNTTPEKVGKGSNEIDVLKPADARIPHPHLIAYAKDQANPRVKRNQAQERYSQRLIDDSEARAKARERKIAADEARKTRVETSRWQFVVTDVKATKAAATSKGLKQQGAIGDRYGVPFEDRKKGQQKIPQRVPV